jgi:hypothetical protein
MYFVENSVINPLMSCKSNIKFYGKNWRQVSHGEALCRPYTVFMIDCHWQYQKMGKSAKRRLSPALVVATMLFFVVSPPGSALSIAGLS